jgi:hypothetical protein
MSNGIHPAAPHHLPPFITAPGETDYFYNGSVIFLVLMVVVLGTLYFRLHALPEHLAHGSESKLQFQLVGVLALLALFTHNTAFWVAALLLALIRIPDLSTPLSTMADALSRMAGRRRSTTLAEQPAGGIPGEVVAPQILVANPTASTPSNSVDPATAETAADAAAAKVEPVGTAAAQEAHTLPKNGTKKRRTGQPA